MSRSVSMIGLFPRELPWIRTLVALLRHPDPTVAELTRQALLYLSQTADSPGPRLAGPAEGSKNSVMVNCLK